MQSILNWPLLTRLRWKEFKDYLQADSEVFTFLCSILRTPIVSAHSYCACKFTLHAMFECAVGNILFLQNAPSNSIFFSSSISCATVSMPLEGLGFVKTLVTFDVIYTTDPLLQNMTKIVCLRWLTFDNFNYKLLGVCWITCASFFQNQGSFPQALSLKRSRWPSLFFAFLTQVTHYLRSKILEKSIDWKIFTWTSFC